MQTDPLFLQLFTDLPSTFFTLVGRPAEDASLYEVAAIEYKSSALRLDGLFRPLRPEAGPAYLWEAQFYRSDKFYANLWTKIGRFLEHGDPSQDWVAVAIYPIRSCEQRNVRPYRCLLESEQMVPIYLDELPPPQPDEFGMGILDLIAAQPKAAMERARAMVPRVRKSKLPIPSQRMLLQFIETVIVHQFPKMSREEIEKMLQVTDVRQTRVYQEAREEGLEEARNSIALRMLEKGTSISEVAETTGLTPAQVRKLAKKSEK